MATIAAQDLLVPPSGGSLEIGNVYLASKSLRFFEVPPSGGSLEIGNKRSSTRESRVAVVPPSGGSLEIGNCDIYFEWLTSIKFPLRGDP